LVGSRSGTIRGAFQRLPDAQHFPFRILPDRGSIYRMVTNTLLTTHVPLELTKRDLEIAGMIFEGELSAEKIGERVGLSGRQIRYIASGEHRPHIKRHIDVMTRDLQTRERHRLIRAKARALTALDDALSASTADGRPDHSIRIKAAIALRSNVAEVLDNVLQPMTQAEAIGLLQEVSVL